VVDSQTQQLSIKFNIKNSNVSSVLNPLSQLGLLIVLSLITHSVPVMQTLSPRYLKLISARLCLINSSISAFFGARLLRLSVKTREAELNRRSLAMDVGGAAERTVSIWQHVRHWDIGGGCDATSHMLLQTCCGPPGSRATAALHNLHVTLLASIQLSSNCVHTILFFELLALTTFQTAQVA